MHFSDYDTPVTGDVQVGSRYVSGIINALMVSPSGKDWLFIFGFDEGGSFNDHAPPQPAVSPDGIPLSGIVVTARMQGWWHI
jgi:hypothetical protein